MAEKIRTHTLGKLEIYIEPAHKVRHGERTLFRKLFPRSAYLHIVDEAKKDGVRNVSVHQTHASYAGSGNVETFVVEGDNSRLAMCVELIDGKERLEAFFVRHRELLQGKVIVFKEVEVWDTDKPSI